MDHLKEFTLDGGVKLADLMTFHVMPVTVTLMEGHKTTGPRTTGDGAVVCGKARQRAYSRWNQYHIMAC